MKRDSFKISMVVLLLGVATLLTAISVSVVGYFWYRSVGDISKRNIESVERIYVDNAKEYSKYVVDNIINEIGEDINYTYQRQRSEAEKRFFAVLKRLYGADGLNRKDFLFFAKELLNRYTFAGDIDYYLFDFNGRCLFNPFYRGTEGESFLDLRDIKGSYHIKKMIDED